MSLASTSTTQYSGAPLIDLIGAPDVAHPLDAETWLFVLTRHRLVSVTPRRTPAQTFDAWRQWWYAGGKRRARVQPA